MNSNDNIAANFVAPVSVTEGFDLLMLQTYV
jgi:hypothetical protein